MTISFEDQLREDLRAAVGDASFDASGGFEPASVIRLGQRAVQRRRLGYAASLAALAVVAVVAGQALGDSDPSRAVSPPAGSSTSASATTHPGAFGALEEFKPGGKDGDDPDALANYTVRGVEEGGRRSVVLTDITDEPAYTLSTLPLDEDSAAADIVFKNGPKVVFVGTEPPSVVRLGRDGPTLQQAASVPIAGTNKWLTMGSVQDGWLGPWDNLFWSTVSGASGTTRVPNSSTSTVPAKAGSQGWDEFVVRFTAHPSSGGTQVDAEHFEPGLAQMVYAGTLTLPDAQDQVFIRGDGANYSAIYGLTRTKPVTITPRGDTASRLAGGWTSTSAQLGDSLWATAIQLTGLDDSSVGVPSLTWKDAAGASHTFDLP
ncbi:MAG: hypothetical protein ABIO48_11175 [Pedococcus sp.]